MKKFTDWLKNEAKDCGMCAPPLEPQKALEFLQEYLLGEGWYVTTPESTNQVNTEIVFEILSKHSSEFRKEWKKYTKKEDWKITMLKNLFSKIKLHIKKAHCYIAHIRSGWTAPCRKCCGHYHNGEAYRQCSKCPYFSDRKSDGNV